MSALICYCSCPDAATAAGIGEAVVRERLAACVNLFPGMRSIYRWQGKVEQADEVLLLIKTRAGQLDALAARLKALHPYELPELIAVPAAGGLPAYLAWIDAETSEEP